MSYNNVEISKMSLTDFNNIKDILYSDFDDFWNENTFVNELESENSYYLVAKINNDVIGFAGIIPILDEADISNIVVHKNFRNKKIGTLLLEKLLDLAISLNLKNLNLEVRESNLVAITLYKKFGFEECGIRKKYYNNAENAILMRKKLIL